MNMSSHPQSVISNLQKTTVNVCFTIAFLGFNSQFKIFQVTWIITHIFWTFTQNEIESELFGVHCRSLALKRSRRIVLDFYFITLMPNDCQEILFWRCLYGIFFITEWYDDVLKCANSVWSSARVSSGSFFVFVVYQRRWQFMHKCKWKICLFT